MRLLNVTAVSPADRKPVDVLYPVLNARVSLASLSDTMRFNDAEDELGPFRVACLDVEGVVVEVHQPTTDTEGVVTFYLDAEDVAQRRRVRPLSFAAALLSTLGIAADRVTWKNPEVDALFPVQRAGKDAAPPTVVGLPAPARVDRKVRTRST